MEKLIELLNEYERSKGTNLEITNWKCVYWNLSYFWYGNWYSEFLCISNRYGFIDWLVENEKIDKDKVKLLSVFQETWYYNLYQSLLMILSIQDNPIEFLCSVLK